jgi:hypothetical protein
MSKCREKLAALLFCGFCCISLMAQTPNVPVDSDNDGIPDEVEQTLLEQFEPRVMVSATDCAGIPAQFVAGQRVPTPAVKDGTIYGQVFPVAPRTVEIHYYTLWDRDCGRRGHPLDAEHVSALVSLAGPEPTALDWYAGAHEDTACDISSGTRAAVIGAEHAGPHIWSSAGKHALYFSQVKCDSGSGCGADSCADNVELARTRVINIGERNAPANGAVWVGSPTWPFGAKMDSDFTPTVLNLLATSPDEVITVQGRSTFRGTIQVSGTVLDAAGTGADHTSSALDTADTHTSKSLGTATDVTERSLRRAWNAVFHRKTDSK